MTRETAATRYTEGLVAIENLEEKLLDSPNPITRSELKELGKLHRKVANDRIEIFRIWNREEPIVKKKSLFEHIFLK
jgi:hypothetical protein